MAQTRAGRLQSNRSGIETASAADEWRAGGSYAVGVSGVLLGAVDKNEGLAFVFANFVGPLDGRAVFLVTFCTKSDSPARFLVDGGPGSFGCQFFIICDNFVEKNLT